MKKTRQTARRRLERAAKAQDRAPYVLKLYVAGMNERSSEAIENVTATCERHLKGRYDLEVIDIYQQPTLAQGEQIVAVPTLLKKLPWPLRRIIGNLAAEDRLLIGLDLKQKE